MNVNTVLVLGVVAASLFLFLRAGRRLLTAIALAASVLEALLAFGLVQLGLKGVPLGLVLGGTLAACGVLLYLQVGQKPQVAAATVLALVGGMQVLAVVL
ncbi:hypothetical protein [Nannocystis punicea]|uniref:Uncharacterized protein n=1 Tax=Nannocystis punicea TaxID=2995304 RepID=A0ABY7GXH7_9BACT|nr:hypothetical protein [Nannocystis poenicansa]WAS91600.1 hypothetical protein O0S08_35920 [Nannocystis poenicansa]